MGKLDALLSDIDAIDALANGSGTTTPTVAPKAVVSVAVLNPEPTPEPVEARPEPAPAPAPVAEAKVPDAPATALKAEVLPPPPPVQQGPLIMPMTGKIIEDVSSALDLITVGLHARIVQLNLHEQSDQLGPVSMLMAALKRVKTQADTLLGRAQT